MSSVAALFALLPLIASVSEGEGVRRVKAHLSIDDSSSAVEEAAHLAESYPDSSDVARSLLQALAAAEKEEELWFAWDHYSFRYPHLIDDRALLEELSWTVLRRGLASKQNSVRLSALIGVYLTQGCRSIPILKKMMSDANAIIRLVAVQMSADYGDAPLKEEIARLLVEEKVWMVRLQAIKSAGALRIKELIPRLQTIVQSDRVTYEEREAAIEALLAIYEKLDLSEWRALARSNRAGMRLLACSIAAHFEMEETRQEIVELLSDPHPDVRVAALNAFGLFFRHSFSEEESFSLLNKRLEESHPSVSITAAWAAMLINPEKADAPFRRWIQDNYPESRRLAAAALAATGGFGAPLAQELLQETEDSYVRANLALGLIGQRLEVALCCDALYSFMEKERRMWMWDQQGNPLFKVLAPSQVHYMDQIPNYPEAIDQMTRLELCSLLAIVEDPRALNALKVFLQQRRWGISGVAAATLLQEGDESSLSLVRELMEESDPNVQLQACLVLAMLGKDPLALPVLQNAYPLANHERKLHILEALGHLGSMSSVPFLLTVFKEPFPILRIAAAASLIQCVHR
ncbi:MAG: HEAT repeat domain-containing protein [Verrucomicrobiota bacterium]|nr:HEAT repeat domain-containing protein [Verrucomicrobiota bacterium]